MENGWQMTAILMALALFGMGYNAAVSRLEKSVYGQGITAMLVVVGVGITVAAATIIIGMQAAMILLACFAASGAPMVVGYWLRHAANKQRNEEAVVRLAMEALNDQTSHDGICHETRAGEGNEQ